MIRKRLLNFMKSRRATMLGVGPMSKNCVDATIELANEHEIPIFMIASRRQIDSNDFGGGYVNQWDTSSFADYVFSKDKKGKIILARDHGGPWQNPLEVNKSLSLKQAMDSAKSSYEADILAGFQMIHIDPSVDIHGTPGIDEIIDRIFELYEYCWNFASARNKDLIFEIGTDEQSGGTNTIDEVEYLLKKVHRYCEELSLPIPSFVVVQTGTRTLETRNVGSFGSPFRVRGELPAEILVPKILELCGKYEICMKEHNADYLSDESLSWHPKLGIHAANVAPEFGVAETKAFIEIMQENKLRESLDQFIELALASRKWEKWMAPESQATEIQKAMICGHYVFASPQFAEIKSIVEKKLSISGIEMDQILKDQIKKSIKRYLYLFRLLEAS